MKWNADLYEKYGQERLQPTIDLINRLPNQRFNRIIDIGCGSGMSTMPLRQQFPYAEILGVDSSKEMLEKATESNSEILWEQKDCSERITEFGKFDLVFSNAFLQWLQNQEEFISWIPDLLNENGVLAMQIPNYDNMPVKHCVDRVIAKYGDRFAEVNKMICHNKSIQEYYDLFSAHFQNVTIWQTNYAHVMDSHEAIVEFVSATGIRPYLQELSDLEQVEMKQNLVKELKKEYPIQKNGKILFPFERIEVIAKKY